MYHLASSDKRPLDSSIQNASDGIMTGVVFISLGNVA